MNVKYKFLSLFLASAAFVGCQDMDLLPEGEFVTDKQKEDVATQNPERAQDKVNAIFAAFNQYMPNASALGAERHNDIGYPTLMLAMSSNGHDEISDNNGYNWTGYDLTFEDRQFSMNECIMVWNNLYSIVFAANKVVAAIDEKTEDSEEQFFLAQGHGARGFAYWVLAQLYQFTYVDSKELPCVPVITDLNAEDAVTNGCPRSKVKDVYVQIEKDLNKAIDLLTKSKYKRGDKRYISLSTAYGLRARMYQTMADWPKALADANKAIEIGQKEEKLSILSITKAGKPGFNSSKESNWMWGILVKEKDGVVTSGICNWPSHFGSLSYGYANFSGGFQISKKLYKEIKSEDVRKGWWLDSEGKSIEGYLDEAQIAFVEENQYKPLTQVKFAPYNGVTGTSINASDIPLMRFEEMYLIKAEAEANGAGGEAQTTLKDFLKNRIEGNYTVPADILNEIYLQRRIEFWGEGLAWFDIMRLKTGVDRRGCGYPNASSVFKIEPTDNILLWRIPEVEIQANKALTPDDSPAVTLPKPVADI